ncbi:MAG TPA: sugar nucleotide-binding protein [Thermoleophilaceae bacterium]|nr:sugar nucleotide-binding protein [Thermoleophilaceae bacterium]
MRIFVTGLGGYLGRAIAELNSGVAGISGRAQADVRDVNAVANALDAAGADAVIHTAYIQDGPDARSTNLDGSQVVARAAAERGLRLVHLSTDVVFSGKLERPLREDDTADPITGYGRTKADAEAAVMAAHPGAVLVRTSLIYGGATPSRQERLALDPALSFYEDELRCPIAAPDLAAAVLELAARPEISGPLHVAGRDALSRLEFAQLISTASGRDPGAVRGARRPPDRPGDLRLDCTCAHSLLSTRIRGVRDLLR